MIDKNVVLAAIDLKSEVVELLGHPKNNKYKCFNAEAHKNGDLTPSLTMSAEGHWKCHTCVTLKGDFLQLYMDVKGIDRSRFGEVLLHFARKYAIDFDKGIVTKKPRMRSRRELGVRESKKRVLSGARDIKSTKYARGVLDWLLECYGITLETAEKWLVGWSHNHRRLYVPIPKTGLWKNKEAKRLDAMMNIRQHDIMRYHCNWHKLDKNGKTEYDETGSPCITTRRPDAVEKVHGEWKYNGYKPVWDGTGKVTGCRGHNSVYIYPMSILNKEGTIWLVGGELKALLLNQLGINAISFTCGEGSYASDLLHFLAGRKVRIVYDIDATGQKGAQVIGQALLNAGAAVVDIGSIPPEGLPSTGDITDYLRKHKWDIESLNQITWRRVQIVKKSRAKKVIKQIDFLKSDFKALTNGDLLGKMIEVPAIISGKGTTPFAVPAKFMAKCPRGEANQITKCRQCSLAQTGFKTPGYPTMIKIESEQMIDLTGLQKKAMASTLKIMFGIPPKCHLPSIKIKHKAVEKVILVPTVDVNTEADTEYRHHQIYVIDEDGCPPKENEEYHVSGKLIGDPRNHAFTLAALKIRPITGNVFTYSWSNTIHEKLRRSLWTDCENAQQVLKRLVTDLRENVVFKYGVDTMITVELISWFMPFKFKIGNHVCHKICPEVMIIGDTRVGKSTTARDLAIHLGAGRYVDCGANTTFVGLVGGNTDIGSHRVFTWGVLPTSHRGHVTLDESNKLDLRVWGGLTNLKSSGVAERTTASGARRTRSAVRFLTLCNPRGSRPLSAYDTPLDAAIEVVGTPQDLARIDLLYVAWALRDTKLLNTLREPSVEQTYTKEIARYHHQWAWSLTSDRIRFASREHVLSRAADIVDKIDGIRIIAPSEAKFKIGRLAAAIATIVYSIDVDTGKLIVMNEHVDMAYSMIIKLYSDYMRNAGVKTGIIPKSIKDLFDKVHNPKMLRILSTSDVWTEADLRQIFSSKMSQFKYEAQLEHGLMHRRGKLFKPVEGFQDLIRDYVNMRLSREGKR